MKQFIPTLLACAAQSGAALVTGEEKKTTASDLTQVTKFLKDHVMGKTVVTPKTTFKADDGKMEGEYEDQTTFNRFTEIAHGFSFDMTMVSKATRYELDKDGKRILPGRDLSGTEIYRRYEIFERVSTKKLTGTARLLSMTTDAPSREGSAILVTALKVVDGKLSYKETLPGYLDMIASKGKYKPGSWDAKTTFKLVAGKLWIEYEATSYDIDPETLERTPAKEKARTFLSKEIEEKADR